MDFIVFYRVVDARCPSSRWRTSPARLRTSPPHAPFGGRRHGADEVLARREAMNQILRTKLDEVTERWA